MNELQKKLIEMMNWFHQFMVEHNIRYYIIGGTLLGAVRHGGFIPWDDDMDIAVPREDYERLIELLREPLDHYVIESPKYSKKDYLYNIAKLYDINTTMTQKLKKNVTRGVFIDIFPLDGIGNSYTEAIHNYRKIDRLNMLLASKTASLRKGRKLWKNLAAIIGYILPINAKRLINKIDIESTKLKYDESNYVGTLPSTYRSKEIVSRDIYGEPTEYNFEYLKLFGPEKCNEYLTHIYGDWQELPPEEKRHSAHDFIFLDLEKSYLKLYDEDKI